MKIRKLVATGLIAGSLSVGAAGVASIGAGSASALPLYPSPCGSYTVCDNHPKVNMKATGEYVPWYTKYLGLHPAYQ